MDFLGTQIHQTNMFFFFVLVLATFKWEQEKSDEIDSCCKGEIVARIALLFVFIP